MVSSRRDNADCTQHKQPWKPVRRGQGQPPRQPETSTRTHVDRLRNLNLGHHRSDKHGLQHIQLVLKQVGYRLNRRTKVAEQLRGGCHVSWLRGLALNAGVA